MLMLANFETQVGETILQRGKEYFRNGAVEDLEQTSDNDWEAKVEGSEDYFVEIKLDENGTVTAHNCDCPYDGGVCKHQVATLFAIRQQAGQQKKKATTKTVAGPVINKLISKISLGEYQEFIRHYAKANKRFQTDFELFFADKDNRIDISKKYTDLLRKLIKQHSDRGFVDYKEAGALAREVRKLLAGGNDLVNKSNFRDAFVLAKTVLEEMIEVTKNCDDSSGNIGGVLADTIEMINTIATADTAAFAIKEKQFDYLIKELTKKDYYDYGNFGYDLFDVLNILAIKLQKQEAFILFLDNWIAQPVEKYSNYRREFFKKAKISFLEAIGKKEEAQKLVQQNMDIVEVRQGEVDKAIAKKDYPFAKQLIQEGIKIANAKSHPGTVSAWIRELLRIAIAEKDALTIRYYTRYFAVGNGSFHLDYYVQWKNTYPSDEWKKVIDTYITETTAEVTQQHQNDKTRWRPNHPPLLQALVNVLIAEGYWNDLLMLLQKEASLNTVLKMHPYLAKRFPKEMLELYLPLLQKEGETANDRNAYTRLAGYMKNVMKDIPESTEKIRAIAEALKAKNPKRPAMIEELNKVLK